MTDPTPTPVHIKLSTRDAQFAIEHLEHLIRASAGDQTAAAAAVRLSAYWLAEKIERATMDYLAEQYLPAWTRGGAAAPQTVAQTPSHPTAPAQPARPPTGQRCARETAHGPHDACPGLRAHPSTMIGRRDGRE